MEELCKLLYAGKLELSNFVAIIFTTVAVVKSMKIKQHVLYVATL